MPELSPSVYRAGEGEQLVLLLGFTGSWRHWRPLLPHQLERLAAMPMGFALAWLGYALWSERRAPAAEPVPGMASPQLRQTVAE